jgi:hypothetical protein
MKYYKDKRVDKRLENEGVIASGIFYSPIQIWLINHSAILLFLLFVILTSDISFLLWKFNFLIIAYLFLAYLVNAYLHNSFALTLDKLYIVNPNFPFIDFHFYDLNSIYLIKIDKSKTITNFINFYINFSDANYVEIHTLKDVKRFYCISLETFHHYDENSIEKTIDDFCSELLSRNIKVEYNLT